MRITFRRNHKSCFEWHPWFAWRPKHINREWVWLERIERRRTISGGLCWWEYR